MKISVKPQNGKIEEKVINLKTVTIGRSRSCDFPIDDESLSRRHSQIDIEEGQFFITDLGSANGVYIDGNRIPPLTKTKIASFQIIYMGPLEFQFFDTDEAPSFTSQEGKTNPMMRRQDEPTISQATRRIDRKTLSKLSSKKSNTSNDKASLGLYLSAALLVAVIFGFYKNFSDRETQTENVTASIETSPDAVVSTQAPVKIIPASEEFLEKTIYLQRGEARSCESFENLCQELLLKKNDGIVKVQDELFIYVDPTQYLDQKGFSSVQDKPLVKDAAAIYQVLRNPVVDLLGKEISQIHLILLDESGEISKVYRFHPNSLKEAKIDIITTIGTGVSTGNFEGFSEFSKQFIPSKEFQNP